MLVPAAVWDAWVRSSGWGLVGERASPRLLLAVVGGEGFSGEMVGGWGREVGFATSSKELVSSSSAAEESSSSLNLEARSLIEAVWWVIDGGGPRSAEGTGSGVGSAACGVGLGGGPGSVWDCGL